VKPGPIGAGKIGDFKKGDRGEIGKKGSLGPSAGIFFLSAEPAGSVNLYRENSQF